MRHNLDAMLALMAEVEAEDPIDFADLPFDEDALRRLVMTSLLENDAQLADSTEGLEQRVLVYLVTAAKLVLENLVLHARLMRSEQKPVDLEALLNRLGGKAG